MSAKLATSLTNWRHSGFSVDNSIRLPAHFTKARKALSQYISRPPLSLKKTNVFKNGDATVICYTSDNDFFKGKMESFSVILCLLDLIQDIPHHIVWSASASNSLAEAVWSRALESDFAISAILSFSSAF